MKTEKEKMQAGETYYAFDPELMKLHRDCLKWVEEYNLFGVISDSIFTEVRMVLLIITVRFSIRPGFIWGKIY